MTAPPAALREQLWRSALLVALAAAALRLAFAAVLPLVPDETYYWDWSRRLAPGYFDHPPAIALLIAAGTRLLPSPDPLWGPLAVRLAPVAAGTVAALALAATARRLAGDRAALVAALAFAAAPLAAWGLVLATPDAPLLATVSVTLYATVRALQSPLRSGASLVWWSLAGIALGAAFTSKYTAIFFPMGLLAAVLVRPSLRHRLREPGPYVAAALATLLFVPVLAWNATHDWISFRFQIEHGLGRPRGSALSRELDLVGGQIALLSPLLFALAARSVARALRRTSDDISFTLAIIALGSWMFFVYSALRRPVEANWPALSYLPALALVARDAARERASRWTRPALMLAAAITALGYAAVLYAARTTAPLPRPLQRVAREMAGWDVYARAVAQQLPASSAMRGRSWIAADRYQEVSELAFHLPRPPRILCLCLSGRHNQYELWPDAPTVLRPGDTLLLALADTTASPPDVVRLAPSFAESRIGPLVPRLRGGDTVSVRRVWILAGYRGGWPPRRER